jgi:hypothetical protein
MKLKRVKKLKSDFFYDQFSRKTYFCLKTYKLKFINFNFISRKVFLNELSYNTINISSRMRKIYNFKDFILKKY